MRPVIGLMPLWDEERNTIRMHPGYHDSVLASGGLPLILPFATEDDQFRKLAELCDGFVFTGGPDVSPSLYGEETSSDKVYICEKRDVLEAGILKFILETDKPVFGICRGIQLLNAALGGTLYQDLPTYYPSDVAHWQTAESYEPTHNVNIVPGSLLEEVLGKTEIGVNTFHHQGIKDLAPGLEVMARSDDGLVESFRRPASRFFWAVQWHPEMMFGHDENSRKLFARFVRECK